MVNALAKLKTLAELGWVNLGRVGLYRIGLKLRLHPVLKIGTDPAKGPFFAPMMGLAPDGARPREGWQAEQMNFFGRTRPIQTAEDTLLDWQENPTLPTNGPRQLPDTPWWKILDFGSGVGDIKTVWEASRMDWVVAFATRAANGSSDDLNRLNAWLSDWSEQNPPYLGINWKCGQEASFRVLHLTLAACLLQQDKKPLPGLRNLIRVHLARIAPTMSYAIGQANNHGTSEAAALFVGGSFLGEPEGHAWAATGRRWLDERAKTLIEPDGTFSQYSLTYHRLMLDTYGLAEFWRRRHGLPRFADRTYGRLKAATYWLEQMTDPATGGVPNIGSNDGAQIAVLSSADTRDFRPSVQLATALFFDRLAYTKSGLWDQPLIWLGLARPKSPPVPLESVTFDQGGFHVLRKGPATAYLRYPRFRFRPSQADALHCDLWIGGENLLPDAGTFSYNSSAEDTAYFNGTAAHNTIAFDGRDQMPRLGRFLFGDWLQTHEVQSVETIKGCVNAVAAYRDGKGAVHHRHLSLTGQSLTCTDRIEGPWNSAILRWRLAPGIWRLEGQTISDGTRSLSVTTSTGPAPKLELTKGRQSLYYLQENELDVFEITLSTATSITTKIFFG